MENTGYVGLSYQLALQRKMALIANNVANVDTSGYKSAHMKFVEHLIKTPGKADLSMVSDYGNYRDFSAGALQQTGNPLDVALEGNGFLGVQTPDGEKFTRNGSFRLNELGQLITSNGLIVSDTGGKPISIPIDAKTVTIAEDGSVAADGNVYGRLKVVTFEKPQDLKPVGNSLFQTDQSGTPDTKTLVKQGMIEGSNVNSVLEMTNMIEVLRNYQSVARLLQNEGDMQSNMIQKMSRL